MTWFIGFDLVDDTNRTESPLHCDDVTPIISATRCKRHFIKACLFVCACYNFLPLPPVKLINDSRVRLHEFNDIEPRPGDSFNQLTFRSLVTRDHDCLKQDGGARRKEWSDASRSPDKIRGLHGDHVSRLMLGGICGVHSA